MPSKRRDDTKETHAGTSDIKRDAERVPASSSVCLRAAFHLKDKSKNETRRQERRTNE